MKIISKHCINKQTAQWFSQITATFYSCFFFVNVERRVIQSKHSPSPPQTFIHSSQRINFSNYWQYVSVADSGFLWCGGRINEKGRGATIGRKSWCIYSEQMAPQHVLRAFYNILVAIGRTQVERSHPRVHECCLLVIHPLTFHVLMYLHWRIFNWPT